MIVISNVEWRHLLLDNYALSSRLNFYVFMNDLWVCAVGFVFMLFLIVSIFILATEAGDRECI